MPDEKWWLKKFNEKNWGACFECCDYEGMVDDIRGILAEHSRRIAEMVEGLRWTKNGEDEDACPWCQTHDPGCQCEGRDAALDAVIAKLRNNGI